jgi:surface protein
MFSNLPNLELIEGLEDFDTSNVTAMEEMFYDLPKISSLNLSSFITDACGNMTSMFNGCSSLTTLDLTSFSNQGLVNNSFDYMVADTTSLQHVYVSSKWDLSKTSIDVFSGSGTSQFEVI